MIWLRYAPMILQSEDGLHRIYKGYVKGTLHYTLKRTDTDRVWTTIATANTADELKQILDEEAA